MDELRLKLSTKFMKSIVSRLLTKMIYRKTGYRVNVQINDFDFWSLDGDTTVKMNVEARMSTEEFNKIIKCIDID